MRAVDLIRCIRDRQCVEPAEIARFVQAIVSGEVPDYQTAAFLMAAFLSGLDDSATTALTLAMRDSGDVIDLSHVPGIKVDKHSTGGVGDKISLPLAPLVAACGVAVPMVSGRGLGHTGGTLDKLEAIPGFRIDIPTAQFQRQVAELGCCLSGQGVRMAPADKLLYALRDVTATVESVPLITASILAKKLAEGIDALVLDVKVGRGAFMKDEASARHLAESIVRVGGAAGLRVRAILTRMDEPLGTTIGNALEVREAIAILRGEGPADTTALTVELGAEMLVLGGAVRDPAAGRLRMQQAIADGSGLEKFRAIIAAQGGDPRILDDPDRWLPRARYRTPVSAEMSGYVARVDAYVLGLEAMKLGAGRARAEDRIDPAVGIELCRRSGDRVRAGETLAIVHHNSATPPDRVAIGQAFELAAEDDETAQDRPGLILGCLAGRLG